MIRRRLQTNRLSRQTLYSALLILVLVACTRGDDPARSSTVPTAAILGSARESNQQQTPPTIVRGDELPGRLLFVQSGTVWIWEGQQGRPLFGDGDSWQPAWSPDGTHIAYIERGESYSDLLLADANGNKLDQLTYNGSDQPSHSHARIYESQWAFYPAWSPDSTRIAMAAQYGPPTGVPAFEYNLSLYTLPAVGGTRQQISADNNAHCGQLAYAPDGSAIVYTRAEKTNEGLQQLHRVHLSTGVSAPFPGAPLPSYDPVFSPDGTWLAFAARDGEWTDIWVLPANLPDDSTATPRRLTTLGTARAPAFSPDGNMLAFLAVPEDQGVFELWVADLQLDPNGALIADAPRQITRDMHLDADSGLSWAP